MNRIVLALAVLALAVLALAVACRQEPDVPQTDFVELKGFEDIEVSRDGGDNFYFTVNVGKDWNVSRRESSWVDVIPNSGRAGKTATVRIVVEKNLNRARETMITFSCGEFKKSIRVGQEAAAVIPEMTIRGLEDNIISFPSSSKDPVSFTISSNVEWTAATKGLDWVRIEPLSGQVGDTEVTVTPSINKGNERSGSISISVPGLEEETIIVSQAKPEFTKPVWTWTLDEEHILSHFSAFEADQSLNTFMATDDNFNGILRFVHTHESEDYLTSIVPEMPDRQYYTDVRPAGAKNEMGYGYLGGMKGDYWEFICPVFSTIPAGSQMHIRFLVFGSNQSPAFWNGSYSIDGGEEILLHYELRNYRGGGKESKPTWNVDFECSYVLGWDLPGANRIIPHLIEEYITLDNAVEDSFRFRLTIADDTFTKVIIAWEDATGRSLPSSSLAIVPAANYYEGRQDQVIIEAITNQ